MADYRDFARGLRDRGVNTVPLKIDGSKLPAIYWKHLQTKFITDEEIEEHCLDCGGLAGITGKQSRLFCFDFDLDKQILYQNYWKEFMAGIPREMKERMLINETRSKGYHIWGRSDFVDRSRKLTHRLLTIDEIYARYKKGVKDGLDPIKISANLLNNPRQCIIETRFEGSYGVIVHPEYKRFYGEQLQEFTEAEIKFMYDRAYELDCRFIKATPYKGEVGDFRIIVQYNEDTKASEVMDMIISTGAYEYHSVNSSGDILLRRVGSNSSYSSKIFLDSGVVYDFGTSNIFSDGKQSHTPFETYCAVNGFDEQEGIQSLKQHER